jgi:hypothetical protein
MADTNYSVLLEDYLKAKFGISIGQIERSWFKVLLPYIECEYIDKVEKIIEEKIGWDELLMKRDYKLGCKIIVKSLLNVLPFEPVNLFIG